MPAQVWEVSNAVYHADMGKIGASMLRTALDSPAEYHARYIARTLVDEPTKAKTLGSLVHCFVLEPAKYAEIFCCRPPGIDGRTKDGKEALAKFRAESLGKIEVDAELRDQAKAMAAAVLAHPILKELLPAAIIERGIVWEEAGLTFKCRPDWFIPRPTWDTDLHVDLKTSDDPYPETWLSKSSWNPMRKFGYDLQVAAHYPVGIEAFTGRPCVSGVCVVGNKPPYDAFLYETTSHRNCGMAWRQKAIQAVLSCRETSVWRRPEQDAITVLPEPEPWNYPEDGR